MSINACFPLRGTCKNPLLNDILSYLYTFRKSSDSHKNMQQIVEGVQYNSNKQYTAEEIEYGVRKGVRQGLFNKYCNPEILPIGVVPDPTFSFNPNAALVNPANWCYMCPGARIMSSGTCCYKPCRSIKGSFTELQSCSRAPRFTVQGPRETITIPGVPGSFTRPNVLNNCQIPI